MLSGSIPTFVLLVPCRCGFLLDILLAMIMNHCSPEITAKVFLKRGFVVFAKWERFTVQESLYQLLVTFFLLIYRAPSDFDERMIAWTHERTCSLTFFPFVSAQPLSRGITFLRLQSLGGIGASLEIWEFVYGFPGLLGKRWCSEALVEGSRGPFCFFFFPNMQFHGWQNQRNLFFSYFSVLALFLQNFLDYCFCFVGDVLADWKLPCPQCH